MASQLIEVRKIWDRSPYNAFTDLVRFRDRFFCVFREAEIHEYANSGVRVISSPDGKQWDSEAFLDFSVESFNKLNLKVPANAESFVDVGGPHLCIAPDGRLMINSGVVYNTELRAQSLAWFSEDGRTWGPPVLIGDWNFWIWQITWHKGRAYGTARNLWDRIPRLYGGDDVEHLEVLVKDKDFFPLSPGPSEGWLHFLDDDTAVCLLRLNPGEGYKTDQGHVGVASPPYTRWTWKSLGERIGGPCLIRLPDNRLLACVRHYHPEVPSSTEIGSGKKRTALFWLDPVSGAFTEELELPSSDGDSSYPGMVFHDGFLWVSYYSSHEGNTNIYLAKVRIAE